MPAQCPRARLRLGIPGGGAADFAALPPFVELDKWDAGLVPVRRPIGRAALSDRSNAGTAVISGPSFDTKYGWDVVAICTRTEARRIEAFSEWQSRRRKAGLAADLRMIDETAYLPSEETPHSKTLLAAIEEEWSASWVYGFGVFPVQLLVPDGFMVPVGMQGDTPYFRVGFSLDEI